MIREFKSSIMNFEFDQQVERQLPREAGFTLVEIIISLALMLFIASIAYSSLQGIIRSKTILDDRRESRLLANSVLKRITRELQLAYAGIPVLEPEESRKYSTRTYLVGEEGTQQGSTPADTITFMALEGGQYMPDGGTHSGVVQITYRVAEDPDNRTIDGEKTYYLIREEMPNIRPYKTALKKVMRFPITKNLLSLQFRYFDPEQEEWVSNWGADTRVELPSMVKFSMTLISESGRKRSFLTAVPLRFAEED